MLKWAVGQRIPSSASSTCSRLTLSDFNLNSPSPHRPRHSRTADKENRKKCRRSSTKMGKSVSTAARTRDSIYMHLDSLPIALRDVSNHWSPAGCDTTDRDPKPTKRKHVRLKKSPCKLAAHNSHIKDLILHSGASNNTQIHSNHQDENKVPNKSEKSQVTSSQNKKKQPCNCKHPTVPSCDFSSPSPTRASMLFDVRQFYTIQTSPPEEPDELFHKELPVKRSCPLSMGSDGAAQFICDTKPCEVSTLTKSLSWLQLTSAARRLGAPVDLPSPSGTTAATVADSDLSQCCNSSLEITNPNSAILSDTSLSDVSSKPCLKRKSTSTNPNADSSLTYDISNQNQFASPDSKSKRRCVIFNQDSFPLNTPSQFTTHRRSPESPFSDLDRPSTLRRQKAIRRKPKRLNQAGQPQKIFNKNFNTLLTLPHGIPSPFQLNDTQFEVISQTPMATRTNINIITNEEDATDFNAVSTPKPSCPFDLTNDVFLSPETQPIIDTMLMQTTRAEPNMEVQNEIESKETTTDVFTTPVCEKTWDSHVRLPPKTTTLSRYNEIESSVESLRYSISSRINYDQDIFSNMGSSTPTLASISTATTDRNNPRSRRRLSFTSPTHSKSSNKSWRGESSQLDLRIYYENGQLVVHIVRARNLHMIAKELPCNAYVKVNLTPHGPSRSFHRTCVRKNSFNPKFDHKLTMEIDESDLNKRVLISAWHRDRNKQKSEFLGCISFAVKNILKKEINGSYKLYSHHSSKPYVLQLQQTQDLMASRITVSTDDRIHSDETRKIMCTPNPGIQKLRATTISKKETIKVYEDKMFLQHLELEPKSPVSKENDKTAAGRTPCTITYKLVKEPDNNYGFTIAWTKPPRVERVDPNSLADKVGLKPGDFVVFVNTVNVVTQSEEPILEIIKNCGNQLILEIYRKPQVNGTTCNNVSRHSILSLRNNSISRKLSVKKHQQCEIITNNNVNGVDSRSTTEHSTATVSSATDKTDGTERSERSGKTDRTETSRKLLQLPQITFSSEDNPELAENSRQHYVYELLKEEQRYALCLQFGIGRFLLPLAERKDVIRPVEHSILFQNAQELLRITEDLLERIVLEEGDQFGRSIGKIYLKKFPAINSAYRRYCCGLKRADCILVDKTKCGEFMRLVTDPPIPKKRPDLVAFIHKPLQHFRDILKLLQLISNCKESKELDHRILSKLVSEMQATYKDITVESGMMDCGAEGRPILSLQDLESRLVFTRCKPFTLNTQGRKWIFAGDLNRIEGKSTRLFWALLFSDIILFTKINRDRVVFVTEEPLSLSTVTETQFYIKKRETEFRLVIGSGGRISDSVRRSRTDSPSQQGCVLLAHFHSPLLRRTPNNKDSRKRTLIFRAPSPELKAVWQNLIQRQVIKINTTGQGITPASSPTESPNQATSESAGTITSNSTVYRRQCDGPIKDIIEHKCKIVGKCTGNDRAYHLAKWMRGELNRNENEQNWPEPEIETWSAEMLQKRAQMLDINSNQADATVIDVESLELKKFPISEKVPLNENKLCQKCRETCFQSNAQNNFEANNLVDEKVDAFLDRRNQWTTSLRVPNLLSPVEPFNLTPDVNATTLDTSKPVSNFTSENQIHLPGLTEEITDAVNNNLNADTGEDEEDDGSSSDDNLPYINLQSHIETSSLTLKRYGSFKNLNKLDEVEDFGVQNEKELSEKDNSVESIHKVATTANQSMFSWANRATSFVVQKVAVFEKIGENVQNSTFFDKYLRPSYDFELTSTSQTLVFEDDCENSGGTSGDEFWGTPNSGGASIASNEGAAVSPPSSHDDEDDDGGGGEQRMIEEILQNRANILLVQQYNMTANRMIQNKSRLETLPEAEEENITRTSSTSSVSSQMTSITASDCTMSCPVTTHHKINEHGGEIEEQKYSSQIGQSSKILRDINLRRSQSVDDSSIDIRCAPKNHQNMKVLQSSKRTRLFRFFSREISIKQEQKHERKFWRKLRRRQTT